MPPITIDVQNSNLIFRAKFARPLFQAPELSARLIERFYENNRELDIGVGDIRAQSTSDSIVDYALTYFFIKRLPNIRFNLTSLDVTAVEVIEHTPAFMEIVTARAMTALRETFGDVLAVERQEVVYEAHGIVNRVAATRHIDAFVPTRPMQLGQLEGKAYAFYFTDPPIRTSIVFDLSALIPQGYYVKLMLSADQELELPVVRQRTEEEFARLRNTFEIELT